MNPVQWSDNLWLDYEPMDSVHREFVDLLAQAQQAPDSGLVAAWAAVIDHTALHFGQEDHWMHTTHYAGAQAHGLQHRVVLNLMREGLMQAQGGKPAIVRAMAGELAAWFAKHTHTQDAALALHLRSHVIKPARRARARPSVSA